MKNLASLCTRTLRRIYGRPLRKGAMMSWDEAKRFYWVVIIGGSLTIAFVLAFALEKPVEYIDWFFLAFLGLMVFFCTAIVAAIYGYHHRHEIDVGDEVAMNPQGMYWGAVVGAVAPLIIRRVESLFGG